MIFSLRAHDHAEWVSEYRTVIETDWRGRP